MNQPRLGGQSTWTATMLFAVLAAAVVFTPLTGLVVWFMPVPFIVLSVQKSRILSIVLALVLALVLVAAGLGLTTIVFALGIYLVGWVMGEAAANSETAYPALITGTLVFVMMSLVGLAFLYWSGVHLQDEVLKQSQQSLQMYQPELHLSPAQVQQMSADVAARMNTALPAILAILSFLLATVNYLIARVLLYSSEISSQPLLSTWRMPNAAVWVYVITTFCVVFGIGKGSSFLWSALNNAFVITGFFLVVQGVAFIWRRTRHLPTRYWWLCLTVVAAVLLNSIFILIGLLDSMLMNRRRR